MILVYLLAVNKLDVIINNQNIIPDKIFISDGIRYENTILGEKSNLKRDFIIASTPTSREFIIKSNNDIIISDEYKLKIYNSEGKPLKTVGGKGQGPGEFEEKPKIAIGVDDYLIGYSSKSGRSTWNLFDKNYKFITKKRGPNEKLLDEYLNSKKMNKKYKDIIFSGIINRFPLNEKDLIYSLEMTDIKNPVKYISIVKEMGNHSEEIMFSEDPRYIIFQNGMYEISSNTGRFKFTVTNNYIIYYNSLDEELIDNKEYEILYTIHIVEMSNKNSSILKQKIYTSKLNIDVEKKVKQLRQKRSQKDIETEKEFYKKKVFYSPLIDIYVDNNYLFLFFEKRDVKLKYEDPNKGYFADIFDLQKNQYISTIEMPKEFSSLSDILKIYIQNKYLYFSTSDKDGYPEIRKYKIDSSVYGR